jgi:DNA-binding MarR family transcriptional regulator
MRGTLSVQMHTSRRSSRKSTPGPFRCHCFAIRQLARHVTNLYDRHLAPAHITATQFTILNFVRERPAVTMAELSRLMLTDRTTLLRALKPLQRADWITSSPSRDNSRQLALSLTRRGADKIAATMRLWKAAQKEYEAAAGAARATRVRRDCLRLTR